MTTDLANANKPHIDLRRIFPVAILATLAVFGLPALLVFSWMVVAQPAPPVLLISAVSVVLSGLMSAVGSTLWTRRPGSSELSFGDLMLWNWWRIKRAEDRLVRSTRRLGLKRDGHPAEEISLSREEHLKVLRDLSAALEAKDPYTHGHSQRVARHAFRIATSMGLPVGDLETIRMAAELHDVGKIRIPDGILRKPGKLTDEEYEVIKEHSVVGSYMVASVASLDIIEAVRHHHERWDGTGYPDRLEGTEIPLFARVLAVADTYDAITSSRPYRDKSGRDRAIEIIKEESGTQFDPLVVDCFLESLPTPSQVMAGLAALLP